MASDKGIYRATYTLLLDSGEFQELPPEARHLLLTIKHSRLNNMAGIFICGEGDVLTLATQCGYTVKAIRKGIDTLSKGHWVFWDNAVLWVRNQLKYDPNIKLNNSKHKSGVENILKSLPKSEIVVKFCDYYNLRYPFDSLSIAPRSTETESETEKETESEKETEAPPVSVVQEIISDLNELTGRKFRYDNQSFVRSINGRLGEGYTLEDFKTVHRKKFEEWRDTEMAVHLTPDTLYRPSKFEKYLTQPEGLRYGTTGNQEAAGKPGGRNAAGGVSGSAGKYDGLAKRREAEFLRRQAAEKDQPVGAPESPAGKEH